MNFKNFIPINIYSITMTKNNRTLPVFVGFTTKDEAGIIRYWDREAGVMDSPLHLAISIFFQKNKQHLSLQFIDNTLYMNIKTRKDILKIQNDLDTLFKYPEIT
jgi:hypothetical protein